MICAFESCRIFFVQGSSFSRTNCERAFGSMKFGRITTLRFAAHYIPLTANPVRRVLTVTDHRKFPLQEWSLEIMRMFSRSHGNKLRLTAFIASALLMLLPAGTPATAQTTMLRVVTSANDAGAQVYYALDRGSFRKASLDVQLGTINSGAAVVAAVSGGSYDIGQTSVAALVLAHEHGIPFDIIAPGATYSSKAPAEELLVPGGSAIRKPGDLAGKTIAVVGLNGVMQLAVQSWLEQNHVDDASVKFIEMSPVIMPSALATNRVDAAFVTEPQADQARRAGARVIGHPYDAIAHDFLITAWFTTPAYAKAHPDITRRFAAIMVDSSQWANSHHEESGKILEKYTKLVVSPTMVRLAYATQLTAAEIQSTIDVCAKFGLIKKAFAAGDILASNSDK